MTPQDAISSPRTAAAAVSEAAGRWDARLRAPTCSEADRAAFAAWRDADPAHAAEFERLQALLSALRGGRDQLGLRKMRDGALALAARRSRRRGLAALAAGVAVVALAGGWLVLPQAWRDSAQDWAAHSLPEIVGGNAVQQYRTGVGQRSTVTLADGSVLELNAMTRLEVAFEPQRRSVRLHEGQAIFHVARQPQRPFVVQAAGREIVAVGTAFDVRVDQASLKVTLIEGKVGVHDPARAATPEPHAAADGGGARMPADPRAPQVFLAAGEQFFADLSVRPARPANPLVRAVDVDKIIGWREGQLFFDDQSLADAVAEMNKYSAVRIELADPSLARLRINGMFRTGQQHAFARAVEDYFHIVAVAEGERRILLRPR